MLFVAAFSSGCASSVAHSSASTSSLRHLSSLRARGRAALARRNGASRRLSLGRSEAGQRIVAVRAGDAHAVRVLVVGCIHGNEDAGIAVARALERRHAGADLWIVSDLNPDGHARGTRQNGRGVDLNRNWSSQWPGGGRPWDTYYPGARPFSERETRIARKLILRVRRRVTIWFHQHMNLVWAWGPSSAAGRIYARAAGMRFYTTRRSRAPLRTGKTITCRIRRPSPSSCPPAASRPTRSTVTCARR
jgi:protein MpaA